jgi:hypothetical protein
MKRRTNTTPENGRRADIHPESRVLDAAEGLVEYVASDETLDSHETIILASGWRFEDRFAKNPVFLNSHSMWDIRDCLGRVVSMEVRGGQLVEVVKWAIDVPENDIARLGFEMTAKGYLKAVSVGFIPMAWTSRGDDDFSEIADMARISGDRRDGVRTIFTEQQQYELSACVIGSNPSALAKAIGEGDVSEELASRCGIATDADYEALEIAGRVIDSDEVTPEVKEFARFTLSDHCRRASRARRGDTNFSPEPPTGDSAKGPRSGRGGPPPGTRAHSEESLERMKHILTQTERLLKN